MVRPRPLVTALAALIAAVATTSPARAQALADAAGNRPSATTRAKKAEPTPLEMRPYKVRAWIDVAPDARLDNRGREALISGWTNLVRRFVGQPWVLEVAEGSGPLMTATLDDLTPEAVEAEAKGFDKAWVIRVGPIARGYGLSLSGREWDAATGELGLVCSQPAPSVEDAPRKLFLLALDMFSPTAQIGQKVGGGVTITVQGGSLPAANRVGQVVKVGSVFRAARVVYKPDGSVARIMPIPRTYLRVARINGPQVYCDIITKLRDPFTSLVLGRYKVVAVGLKPTAEPTRLRFVTAPPENKPAAGYTLLARPAPDGPSRVVAITDRDGRVVLDPHFDDNLVILRLVAADLEPLDEFPIMPGESDIERTVLIRPKREAVKLETELISLRDELIDQWSMRARLDALIKPRVEAEAWDEVRLLLDEYDKLPRRNVYETRLEALKQAATEKQREIRQPVLTRTAQVLMNETDALIQRYLDDETFLSYADAYDRYAATAPPEKARQRTLGQGRPEDALANLNTPSASAAGREEARAGLAEFIPEGLGLRIAMPAAPKITKENESTTDGPVERTTLVAQAPQKGTFTVTIDQYEKPIRTTSLTEKTLDFGRSRAMAAARGAKLILERDLKLLDRFSGREIEIEFRPDAQSYKHMSRVRTYLVNDRVYTVGVTGVEAEVRARAAELFLDSFRLTNPPPADASPARSEPAKAESNDAPKGEPAKSKAAPKGKAADAPKDEPAPF